MSVKKSNASVNKEPVESSQVEAPKEAVQGELKKDNVTSLATARGLSRDRIDEMRKQLHLLQELVNSVMIRGEHYGVIPGTQRPTLFKAGAEFLREAYGFSVKSQMVERKFVPASQTERRKDYIEFTYRCEISQDGTTVAVCEASCNNYERRYENLNPFAVMNTIQKMAQKRAYVGAVISATRSSNIFTQDLEDDPEGILGTQAQQAQQGQGQAPAVSPRASKMATPAQAKLVWARLKSDLQLSDLEAREFITSTVGKSHSRELTADDVDTLLKAIDQRLKDDVEAAAESDDDLELGA